MSASPRWNTRLFLTPTEKGNQMKIKLSHSHETGIYLFKLGPGHWRHVDCNDNNGHGPGSYGLYTVGPSYPTKAEALADTLRYVRESWDYKG